MLKLFRSLACRRAVALVLTFAAVASGAAFLAPQESEAQGRCGLEFIYYNEDWSEVVGYRAYEPWECGCYLHSWGQMTGNKDIYDFYC